MKCKRLVMVIAFNLLLTSLILILPSLSDTQLTTDISDDMAPSVIQTNDGNMWVAWHTYRTGNADIFYKTHNGAAWSNSIQLTANQSVDGLPAVMQSGDGTLWVFWTSSRTGNYDVFYKTSSNNGASWSAAIQLTTDLDDDRSSSAIQAADGTIWVIWQSYRTGNYDLFYKTSSNLGASWSEDTQLTTDLNEDKYPAVMQSGDGTLWVFWTSSRTGNYDVFYKTSSNNGASWSAETQLTTDPSNDFLCTLIQDSDGKIWAAWQSDRNINDDILYKIYDGSSWSAENYLTWFADYDRMPSLLQASNGTMWLVWSSDKAGNFDIYYKFLVVDMVVRDLTTSKTIVPQDDIVSVYVIVGNDGTIGVTYNVTAYWDTTSLGTVTKQMIPGLISRQFTFTWNTAGLPYGYYSVSGIVSTALNENDPADNSLTINSIIITIPGDVNGDRAVNILDAGLISAHWYPGPPAGPSGYDANADINGDGKVDISDAAIVNGNWQKSW